MDGLPFAASLEIDPDLVEDTVVITAANHYPGATGGRPRRYDRGQRVGTTVATTVIYLYADFRIMGFHLLARHWPEVRCGASHAGAFLSRRAGPV